MESGIEEDQVNTASRPGARPLSRLWNAFNVWLPALLAVAGLAVALLTQFLLTDLKGTISRPGYGFVLAVALYAASAVVLWARGKVAPLSEKEEAFELPLRWEVGLVATVVALAAFFRFWHLLSFPPGLWYDEGVNATDAITLIDRDHTRIWFDTVFGRSTLYLYLLAGSFKLFGFSIFAIRIVPAMAGLLAVVAFYFLARRIVGPAPAIVGTALFAVSRWAVTFSRVSWEASLQPLLEIVAVWGLIYGLDTKRPWAFALGGMALAAGLYTYIAFRLVPFVLAFLLLYVLVGQWRLIRQNVAGLAVFAAAFVLVLAPLANFALNNQDRFLERQRQVNVFKEIDEKGSNQPLKTNIERSFKMMNVAGDHNGRHNLPGDPQVDEVTAALLVLGLAVGVWSLRSWRKGFVAPWLVASLVPGALTITLENPSAIRGIGALPPLYLLVGLAAAALQRALGPTRQGVLVFSALMAALVAGSTGINYYDIFERQASNLDVYEAFTPEFTQVGRIVAAESDEKQVIVSRQFSGHQAVTVLAHGEAFEHYVVTRHLILPQGDRDALVIVDAEQFGMLPTLRQLYPNLQQDDYVDPYDRVFFTRITIPQSDIAQVHQLTLRRGSASDSARLDREWTEQDLAGGPVDAEWDGYLWIPEPVNASFVLRVPGGAGAITLDGAPLALDGSGRTPPLDLSLGEHRVVIGAHITVPGAVQMDFTDPNTGVSSVADSLYNTSTGDRGFQVVYREGADFSGAVTAQGRVPFPVPVPFLQQRNAIEYVGIMTLPQEGPYSFSLTGKSSAQLFVDGELVVDNGGNHGRTHVEAEIELSAGPHTISIQYATSQEANWIAAYKAPRADWKNLETSDVTYPAGPYRPPTSVTLDVDESWSKKSFSELMKPSSVVRISGTESAAAGKNRILIFNDAGQVLQSFAVRGASEIVDMDLTGDGRLVVLDAASRALYIVNAETGAVEGQVGDFASAAGLSVRGDTAYVASPSGGGIYVVPLGGGEITPLPISLPDAPVRARQPSDIAVGDDGAFYIVDFETRSVIRSPDGKDGTAFRSVGGTGVQLPHIAVRGDLVFLTDPTKQRVLVYDRGGRQRGVYVFGGNPAPHPVGVAAPADGYLYVADASGAIVRMTVTVPPETQAELDALP